MNYVLQFLTDNRQRLELAKYGLGDRITTVVLTPRFRASSHVVFLILSQGNPDPILVAKTPRLSEADSSLHREATNLQIVQGSRPGGFAVFPRVVAFEEYGGRSILVQTALVGRPMDPDQVRRNFDFCCKAGFDSLADMHRCQVDSTIRGCDCFESLVSSPLEYLTNAIPWNVEERRQLDRTREVIEPLRTIEFQPVLEHGDFSHPNILLLKNGRAGVVDWEMANPNGLPAYDLIFFLTYATFARHNARETAQCVPAINHAFFGKTAWARRYLVEYAAQVQLPVDALTPLFALSWVRYMAGLLRRLDDSGRKFSVETADWLRQNRYYAAWRHTVDHLDQLHW